MPVREYLAEPGTLSGVLTGIQRTYGLHVDVTGALGEAVGYMLLGLITPLEFAGDLRAHGIPENAVTGIVGEVNQKIFIPLREKMRREEPSAQGVVPTPPAPQYSPRVAPRVVPVEQKVAPLTPPPAAVPPVATPSPRPAPSPRMYEPPRVPSGPAFPQEHQAVRPVPTVEHALSTAPSPLPPRQILPQQHPAIFHKSLPVPPPNLPTGVPVTTVPVAKSSPVMPGEYHLPALQKPAPAAPPPLSSQGTQGTPHTRYSNDPYREPVE